MGIQSAWEFIICRTETAGTFVKPETLLRYAIENGQLDCVKWLVQRYPGYFTTSDPGSKHSNSLTQLAIKYGHGNILQYLS